MEHVSHSLQSFQKCVIFNHIGDDRNFEIIRKVLYNWSRLDLFSGRFAANCGADTVSSFEGGDDAGEASMAASTRNLYMSDQYQARSEDREDIQELDPWNT